MLISRTVSLSTIGWNPGKAVVDECMQSALLDPVEGPYTSPPASKPTLMMLAKYRAGQSHASCSWQLFSLWMSLSVWHQLLGLQRAHMSYTEAVRLHFCHCFKVSLCYHLKHDWSGAGLEGNVVLWAKNGRFASGTNKITTPRLHKTYQTVFLHNNLLIHICIGKRYSHGKYVKARFS